MRRRDFLKFLGFATSAPLLPGCLQTEQTSEDLPLEKFAQYHPPHQYDIIVTPIPRHIAEGIEYYVLESKKDGTFIAQRILNEPGYDHAPVTFPAGTFYLKVCSTLPNL